MEIINKNIKKMKKMKGEIENPRKIKGKKKIFK